MHVPKGLGYNFLSPISHENKTKKPVLTTILSDHFYMNVNSNVCNCLDPFVNSPTRIRYNFPSCISNEGKKQKKKKGKKNQF